MRRLALLSLGTQEIPLFIEDFLRQVQVVDGTLPDSLVWLVFGATQIMDQSVSLIHI